MHRPALARAALTSVNLSWRILRTPGRLGSSLPNRLKEHARLGPASLNSSWRVWASFMLEDLAGLPPSNQAVPLRLQRVWHVPPPDGGRRRGTWPGPLSSAPLLPRAAPWPSRAEFSFAINCGW